MKAYVRHIGVIDHNDNTHAVTFGPGVNVVTGKSSTGKSALIEIFDFCFGSSDFTVPEGVITNYADIYFVVIRVHQVDIVLARRPNELKAFIKFEQDTSLIDEASKIKHSYFEKDYFLSLSDFKKELGRGFGLRITDTEENLTDRMYRNKNKKKPSPSIRSIASFILQHQNLIANKHAIFYRFDEKEKREQTIEHFKIFVGFADQTYFIKSQKMNALKDQVKSIERQIPRAADKQKMATITLQSALNEYMAISGKELGIGKIDEVLTNPRLALDNLRAEKVTVVSLSDDHVRIKQEAERERGRLIAEFRKRQQKLAAISSSIEFANSYADEAKIIPVPTTAELHASQCPFCHTHHASVEHEANKLADAITWLNTELARSPYLLESFEEQKQKTQQDLDTFEHNIQTMDSTITHIDEQITELEKYKTQYELALKAKIQVELVLEHLLEKPEQELQDQLAEVRKEIKALKDILNDYDIDKKLKNAEERIHSYMNEIGNRFDFESSYQPVNLFFSLDSFDLWHEDKDGRRIFLRSMGSGANWLYCHLTLFMALHRFFCSLGESCAIPSILFLDQPSQVYFPSILDTANEFSPHDIAAKVGDDKERHVDDDIKAVTNLYSQLVNFCKETQKETGIEPQIIVTDHADKLTLSGEVSFEEMVQGRRWRDHGFIDTPPN